MGEADTTVLFRYRGRNLTSEDLVQIRAAIDANYSRDTNHYSISGRTNIMGTIIEWSMVSSLE